MVRDGSKLHYFASVLKRGLSGHFCLFWSHSKYLTVTCTFKRKNPKCWVFLWIFDKIEVQKPLYKRCAWCDLQNIHDCSAQYNSLTFQNTAQSIFMMNSRDFMRFWKFSNFGNFYRTFLRHPCRSKMYGKISPKPPNFKIFKIS